MKNIFFLSIILFAFSCKKSDVAVSEPTKIITGSFWKLDRFTDVDKKPLNSNQINSQAQGIFDLKFQFLDDKRVRGIDQKSQQILNAGTWYLVNENNQDFLNIDIIGFNGKFKLVELTKTKMILQAENNKIISASSTVNLELIPIL